MADAADLLDSLEADGLTLRPEGGKLMVGPVERVTAAHRAAIRANKPGLLIELAVRRAMDEARPSFHEEFGADEPPVRLVEKVVLLWDGGETAMAFDREFVESWRSWNEQARARRDGGGCRHEETEFGRVISEGGKSRVMERCVACKANARGAGKWVPGRDLPRGGGDLPVFKDSRAAVARDLFQGEGDRADRPV